MRDETSKTKLKDKRPLRKEAVVPTAQPKPDTQVPNPTDLQSGFGNAALANNPRLTSIGPHLSLDPVFLQSTYGNGSMGLNFGDQRFDPGYYGLFSFPLFDLQLDDTGLFGSDVEPPQAELATDKNEVKGPKESAESPSTTTGEKKEGALAKTENGEPAQMQTPVDGKASDGETKPEDADAKKAGGSSGRKVSKTVVDAAPAQVGEAGSSETGSQGTAKAPEIAQWEAKVSQKTKAISTDGIDAGGARRVRASGAAAAARAAEERRKQQEGAGEIIAPPPQILDPLLPPELDPVPLATDMVRRASDLKLPNQTMPAIIRTKGNIMPGQPRTQLTADLGTKESSTYTKEMAALDADEKTATGAKNKKELARIRKARKALEKKFTADWAEGKAEPMTLTEEAGPPPSPPLTEQTQADIGKVLAALSMMQDTAAPELVNEARSTAFPGEVLREEAFDDFGREGLQVADAYLKKMIGDIAGSARLKQEDIDRYVAERKAAAESKAEILHGGLTDAAAFEKKKSKSERQAQANEAKGVEEAVEKHIGIAAAEFKTGVDPSLVRDKRVQLVTSVSRKEGQQTGAYQRAGERREKVLEQTQGAYLETYRNAVQTERSGHLKTAWKARKNKASEKPAAEAEAETLMAPTISWLRDELVPDLEIAFKRLKKQASDAVAGFIEAVKSSVRYAMLLIANWADQLTGELGDFWKGIEEKKEDWKIQSRESAKAWESERALAARDALVKDINSIRMSTRYEEEQLKLQKAAASRKLSSQKDKVEQEAIQAPPGPQDAILTAAEDLKRRLFAEERPKLTEKFEKKVWDLEKERWADVDAVAMAAEPGGRSADWIGDQVRDATDRIGTQESKIYSALANLTPLRAKAVRLYYLNTYKSNIENVLKGELSGAEEDRALGLLERDPGKADAGTIAYAINPAIKGGGDVSDVMNVLRETKDPADLRAKFKAEYGFDLDDYLRRSLKGADFERAQEFLSGDSSRRYVAQLKHAVKSKDRKGVEAVYAQIRAEVELDAGKQSEKVRSGLADRGEKEWDSNAIEAEVKRRAAKLEEDYNKKEEADSLIFASTLSEDIGKNFKGAEKDLALAIHEGNESAANAARLKMEDKGIKLTYSWLNQPKLETGDMKVINGVLAAGGERARMDAQRDEEINLWNKRVAFAREKQVAYLRGWDSAKIRELGEWDAQREQKERKESAERIEAQTKIRAERYKNELVASYESKYGGAGSFDTMINRSTYGYQREKAKSLIQQGGILTKPQTLHYAVIEKDADAVKSILATTSEEEMSTIKKEWLNSKEGKRWIEANGGTPDSFILSKFDGDDGFDIKLDIKGKSEDPVEMLKRKKAKQVRQHSSYGLASGGPDDYELQRLDREVAKLERQVNRLKTLKKGTDEYKFAVRAYERQLGYVDRATESHRTAVDRRTDDAAMIVGIIVTAIIIIGTGGAATPFLAAAAAAAGAAASIATKMLMKGRSYIGSKEMWTDIVVGVVDTIVSAATAGLGGRLLKAIRPLAQLSKSAKLFPRMVAHGIAEGAENFVNAIPTSIAQQLMTKGDVSFGETFHSAAMGGGLGGVMGSIGGFKKAAALKGSADILAHRGTPIERLAAWKNFKEANPGKSYKEFLEDLDKGILARQAKDEAAKQAQRSMRRELLDGIPLGQRSRFKDVPIEVISDADFARFTRSELGQAVVIFVSGKPRVLLRESADIRVLRREAKHLIQSVDPKTAHLVEALDEKALKNWDKLSLDDQLRLYGKKLELELDAQQRTIRDLQDTLAAGVDPTARRSILREIDGVRHGIGNLKRRAGEVSRISPQQRKAMKGDPTLRPDYLDQPARLFEKKTRLEIKQELVASLKSKGLDARTAVVVLERLRVVAEAGGPKKPFLSTVKKIEALLKTDAKAAREYVDDIKKTLDDWVGDTNGALAIVDASTKLKNPSEFLKAANKLTSVAEKGAKAETKAALDAVAGRVSKMDAATAHKYLDDLGRMVDAFKPTDPQHLAGFLRATARLEDPSGIVKQIETFAKNRNTSGVELSPRTIRQLANMMADLPNKKAQKFLESLDDFTRSHSKEDLAKLDGFVDGVARAKSGDPVNYLAKVKELIKQRDHGLSMEALTVLASKAGRGRLDVEWLLKTNIFKEKSARAFFDMAARDVNTPWNAYRAAAKYPDNEYLQKLVSSHLRGMTGEYLTFVMGKQLKEAGELVQDAKKTMNVLRRAGIEEVTGQQVKIVTDEFGKSVVDAAVRSKGGIHGLEVKAYGKEYWERILDAWNTKKVDPYSVLTKEETDALASMQRMIKQLKNADKKFGNPPFLMTSTSVDEISGRHRDILDDILGKEMPPGTRILTLPEWEFPKAQKEIERLFKSR